MHKVEVWPTLVVENIFGETEELVYYNVGNFSQHITLRNFRNEDDANKFAREYNKKVETFGESLAPVA